jgi:hypothetical protein
MTISYCSVFVYTGLLTKYPKNNPTKVHNLNTPTCSFAVYVVMLLQLPN